MFSITKFTASFDIILGSANNIFNLLGAVASDLTSCNPGSIRLQLRCTGVSVSMDSSMLGPLFCVWCMCVLWDVKRSLLFIGLVDVETIGGVATL